MKAKFIHDLRGDLEKYQSRADLRKETGVFYQKLYKSDLSAKKQDIVQALNHSLDTHGSKPERVVEAVVKARFDSLDAYIKSGKNPGKLDKILDNAIAELIQMGFGKLVEDAVVQHQAESLHRILMAHQSVENSMKYANDPAYTGVQTFIAALNKIDQELKNSPRNLDTLHSLRHNIAQLITPDYPDPNVKKIQKWLTEANAKLGQVVTRIEREMVVASHPELGR